MRNHEHAKSYQNPKHRGITSRKKQAVNKVFFSSGNIKNRYGFCSDSEMRRVITNHEAVN